MKPTKGAYGISLRDGLGRQHPSLPVAEPDWPAWNLQWRPRPLEDSSYSLQLPVIEGGIIAFDDSASRVDICTTSPPSVAAVMHPWLSTIAAWIAHTAGHVTFHGGTAVIDGRAWVVLGAKEAGKSTGLAWLGLNGAAVGSDDLVVVDGTGHVLTGPGCIDLREGAARYFGAGERSELIAGRVRWRVWAPPAPARVPLAGFVLPQWGDRVGVESCAGSTRLRALIDHRSVLATAGAERELLNLAGLPMLVWTRPRDFAVADLAGAAVLDAFRSDQRRPQRPQCA